MWKKEISYWIQASTMKKAFAGPEQLARGTSKYPLETPLHVVASFVGSLEWKLQQGDSSQKPGQIYCCQEPEVLSVAMIFQEGKPQIERAFLICLEEQGMHQMHEITTRESHALDAWTWKK